MEEQGSQGIPTRPQPAGSLAQILAEPLNSPSTDTAERETQNILRSLSADSRQFSGGPGEREHEDMLIRPPKVEMKTTGKPLQEANGLHAGRWTQEEHENFLIGLSQYGREWKKVAERIKTRTSAQIRSHAQKYFAKLAKETARGGGERGKGEEMKIRNVADLSDSDTDTDRSNITKNNGLARKRPLPPSSSELHMSPQVSKVDPVVTLKKLELSPAGGRDTGRLRKNLASLEAQKKAVASQLLSISKAHIGLDSDKEREQLQKESQRLAQEIQRVRGKLSVAEVPSDGPIRQLHSGSTDPGVIQPNAAKGSEEVPSKPPSRQLFEGLSPLKRQKIAGLQDDELLAVQVLSSNLTRQSDPESFNPSGSLSLGRAVHQPRAVY